jgi:hypothetical protein
MEPLKIDKKEPIDQKLKGKTTREKIENTYTEEIIIGICTPIGTPKDKVIHGMIKTLTEYGYDTEVISLSALIIEHYDKSHALILGRQKRFHVCSTKLTEEII